MATSSPASRTIFAGRYACRRAGVPHTTPNDLRRTYATELHAAGARLATIAPTMGHADTRMLERVYAVLPPAVIGERQQIELGLHRDTTGTDASAGNPGTGGTAAPSEKVPRSGIEPPTRGFSVPFCPSEKARFPLGTSVKHVPRPVKVGTPKHGHARSLRHDL